MNGLVCNGNSEDLPYNHLLNDRQFRNLSICCSVGDFTKEPIKKKDSGPDGTAHHGAQQGKAVSGSGHPQPQYLPCMLARTYTLRATSGNVYLP
ncbi:hypothetical protein AVEN_183825-1 [Araneus ventricosus]|uniref:Uncharacterized protein n=1 Tax=Araneus ventricosus TaxID=182803 RepID=A0A4Y2NA32_ARAVE|nr:hypothetical protein AVEN_183825-1 [Araneus ventricosus]